jgi:hypothetical protein
MIIIQGINKPISQKNLSVRASCNELFLTADGTSHRVVILAPCYLSALHTHFPDLTAFVLAILCLTVELSEDLGSTLSSETTAF